MSPSDSECSLQLGMLVHTVLLAHEMLRQGNYFNLQARLHSKDPFWGKGNKSISHHLIPGSLTVIWLGDEVGPASYEDSRTFLSQLP